MGHGHVQLFNLPELLLAIQLITHTASTSTVRNWSPLLMNVFILQLMGVIITKDERTCTAKISQIQKDLD